MHLKLQPHGCVIKNLVFIAIVKKLAAASVRRLSANNILTYLLLLILKLARERPSEDSYKIHNTLKYDLFQDQYH